MYVGLNDHIIDRIAAVACVIAIASGIMLWHEGLYPISMVVDLLCGSGLALIFIFRKKSRHPIALRLLPAPAC
jgi:hypothetical protein